MSIVAVTSAMLLNAAVAAPANAATIGSLTITTGGSVETTVGSETQVVSVTSQAGCANPAATKFLVRILGPGFPEQGQLINSPTTLDFSATGPITAPLANTFETVGNQQSVPVVYSGAYKLRLQCTSGFGGRTDYGTYDTTVFFVNPHFWQLFDPATATTLIASSASVDTTSSLTLSATVVGSPGHTPVGSVQFRDGVQAIGAPVAVSGGSASLSTTLPAGDHALTALFTPSITAGVFAGTVSDASPGWLPSTSAAASVHSAAPVTPPPPPVVTPPAPVVTPPVVTPPAPVVTPPVYTPPGPTGVTPPVVLKPALGVPVITGMPYVGGKATCVVKQSGSTSTAYAWLKDGKAVPGASASRVFAAKDRRHKYICRVTVKNSAGSVVASSRAVVIGPPALKVRKAPALSGKAKVGQVLKVSAGVWTPVAAGVKYQWLRDGKVIAGARGASYALKKTDKGHKVTCRVTVTHAGSSAGVYTTRPLKIT